MSNSETILNIAAILGCSFPDRWDHNYAGCATELAEHARDELTALKSRLESSERAEADVMDDLVEVSRERAELRDELAALKSRLEEAKELIALADSIMWSENVGGSFTDKYAAWLKSEQAKEAT